MPLSIVPVDDITAAMRRFLHHKSVVMALFDTLANVLGAFLTPHIRYTISLLSRSLRRWISCLDLILTLMCISCDSSGNLDNVLGLPLNMALAYAFLHTRFRRGHVLGAVIMLYGGLVSMLPILNDETLANAPGPSTGWLALFMVALVPVTASNVYKEKEMKGTQSTSGTRAPG